MDSLLPTNNIKNRVAKLYVPSFIVANKRELASLESTYASTLGKVSDTTNAAVTLNTVLSTTLIATILCSSGIAQLACINPVFSFLEGIFDKITGKKKLKEAQQSLMKLHAQLQQNYDAYRSSHDKYTQDIIYDIDEINKTKELIKEKVLLEASKKLQEIGIHNTIGDYQVELLDEDMLDLDTNLSDIIEEMSNLESLITESDSLFVNILGLSSGVLLLPIIKSVSNREQARLLKEKVEEFEKESRIENEKIKADLIRIGIFEKALTNVMNIFRDIAKNLIPLIMDIIDDIEKKYHNNYNEIPSEVLMALHASCKILKGMAEKSILGNKKRRKEATQKDVIKYSNELSKEYNQIKEEILKVA